MEQRPRYDKILSDAIMDRIGEALGVPIGAAHRIVLDVEVGRPIRVYIEFFGDTRMEHMELPEIRDVSFIEIRR